MLKFIRDEIKSMETLQYPRDPCVRAIYLDANESPWETSYNRYPYQDETLNTDLAEYFQLNTENLMLTRGSDEGIDFIVRVFCKPNQDRIMILTPTFGMYEQYAAIQGAKLSKIALNSKNNWQIDLGLIQKSITPDLKIIFLCSPNNPTGQTISFDEVRTICNLMSNQGVVVLDEAYIEYARSVSMVKYLNELPNLIVLRTFSKAMGLAGLRTGVILAQSFIIKTLSKIMPPFAFSSMVLQELKKHLQPKVILERKQQIEYIKAERARMYKALITCRAIKKVYESEGNFFLVECQEIERILKALESNRIYVRKYSKDYLKQCLRISIGLKWQNDKILEVLNAA